MSITVSLSLQIFCICFVFILSLAGYYVPFYLHMKSLPPPSQAIGEKEKERVNLCHNSLYCLMKCCGSGIILGVALMHLLADAVGDLAEYSEYPGLISIFLSIPLIFL